MHIWAFSAHKFNLYKSLRHVSLTSPPASEDIARLLIQGQCKRNKQLFSWNEKQSPTMMIFSSYFWAGCTVLLAKRSWGFCKLNSPVSQLHLQLQVSFVILNKSSARRPYSTSKDQKTRLNYPRSQTPYTVNVFWAVCYSLLVSWGCARVPLTPGNPPSKEALSTSSRFVAVIKSRLALTFAGSSSRSFSLRFGRMTRFTPALCAASTLSLIPPTCRGRATLVCQN